MIPVEPYLDLTYREKLKKFSVRKRPIQVVHGCRQLVSWDVGLSPATSATPVLCCQQVMLGTHRRLPVINRRKVGTTSSHHAPYVQGCTHATMASTTSRNTARWSKSLKACLSSDRSLQLDSLKLESLVIANQQSCGEYVLGVCTHRPSSHGSRQYPKPVV